MAYQARRNDDKEKQKQEDAQSNAANQKAAKAGLSALEKTGGWWGAAAKVANKVDDFTGGKLTELAGKGMTKANKIAPGGKTGQKLTNKVANSKMADKAYDAYTAKNGKAAGAANKAKQAKDGADKAKKAKEGADKAAKTKEEAEKAAKAKEQAGKAASSAGEDKGGEKDNSLPSSDDKKDDGTTTVVGVAAIAPVVMSLAPLLLIPLLFMAALGEIASTSDFDDASGISSIAGLETGNIKVNITNPEQKAFYERVMEVKSDFAEDGRKVDPLLVVSVYHAFIVYHANISYSDMTKMKIEIIADAMFDEDGRYDKRLFEDNLKNLIIDDYLPNVSDETKDAIVKEVFDYVERYYSFIGKKSNTCSSVGSCTYDIKGFYINGSNFKKDMSVNDLYVRLMQCGYSDNHDYGGTYGEPLEDEELVPFEKYILGVAYQEIGPNAPEEAFKAQLIAARSYILARPTSMGTGSTWRKLEQENGQWVLQVASCTADQVYCDPDKGCSAENGDGQWKQVHSGTDHGKMIKGPLSEDAPARRYANAVQGETLVNDQGYIIMTNYDNNVTNKFIELANEGLDYKQILMEAYSDNNPSDMAKSQCSTCASNTEAANWKQYEGEWTNVTLGSSGKTIKQIGCLATSIAIQIARSGVQTTIPDFNPGTFVDELSKIGAFSDTGSLNNYSSVEEIAPEFKYQGHEDLGGMSRENKLSTIKNIVNQQGVYAVAQVGTEDGRGQHWVAIESVNGDTINMMDPGSSSTDMWEKYDWQYTVRIVYYKVG